ncbi:MAG: tRNA (N6-threonylcarbamoyladenosine(37)-N6)-methyltransferase TrmO [Desulfotalea sp.]
MKMNENIVFQPIGWIHTPFENLVGMPIQPPGAKDVEGFIELREDLQEGLADLEGFSHLILIYNFHKNSDYKLSVTPFMDVVERGLFSTRAPKRPNMIGLSIIELLSIEGCRLNIRGIDVLNGTPLLDIKPYVATFDAKLDTRSGWLEKTSELSKTMKSDQTYIDK